MSNGNQSAGVLPAEFCGEGINCMGLTKREAFAMAAMQGLLSNPNRGGCPNECATGAIMMADELLKELDK